MPGQQIYKQTLEKIDPRECAGYSNIFLHCGINNLKTGTSPSHCLDIVKDKIEAIRLISPKSKLIISPILPTKNAHLNNLALIFLFRYFSWIRAAWKLTSNTWLLTQFQTKNSRLIADF